MYPFGITGVWKLLSTASVVPFLTQRFTFTALLDTDNASDLS